MMERGLYLKISQSHLQIYFAIISIIEEANEDIIFLLDNSNRLLISECLNYISFKTNEKNSFLEPYKTVEIHIDHVSPMTYIGDITKASLYFPKFIVHLFFKSLDKKADKIYFRGLLTKKRFIETLVLFIKIRDIKGIKILLKSIISFRKSFKIDTSLIYFDFTNRGRDIKFKYIDAEYYKEMANFKYVFCPKGDFVWTYRFFETIQVGSIPICFYEPEINKPFIYKKTISSKLSFSQADANSNLNNFKKYFHLTMSNEILN